MILAQFINAFIVLHFTTKLCTTLNNNLMISIGIFCIFIRKLLLLVQSCEKIWSLFFFFPQKPFPPKGFFCLDIFWLSTKAPMLDIWRATLRTWHYSLKYKKYPLFADVWNVKIKGSLKFCKKSDFRPLLSSRYVPFNGWKTCWAFAVETFAAIDSRNQISLN